MKSVKLKKSIIPIILGMILFVFPVTVTFIFIQAQNKIQKQILKNSMERLDELSSKIITTINLEIKHSTHMLESITELANIDIENISSEQNLKILKKIKNKGNFTSLGIINTNCEIIETNSHHKKFCIRKIIKNFDKFKKNKFYVSDVLVNDKNNGDTQEVLIAIPLFKENEIIGILYGHYPIANLAEKLLLSEGDQQYFQIVDTNGKYISRSANENALAGKEDSLWTELKKYEYIRKNEVENIEKNVEKHKEGFFYFEYDNKGRYVVYRPLGINNWYVFSVLTKQAFNFRVEKVQKISADLLFELTSLNILLMVSIIGLAFYIYKILKEQSKKIEIKNSMLKMLIHKTNDIIFEIHVNENRFSLYKTIDNEDKEFSFSLDYMQPENLLKNDIIRKENFALYQKVYDQVILWETIEKQSLELKINNIWKWYHIYSIIVNKDSIIGILEDFTETKEKELELVKINEKSKYDFLTGLYNRETFAREYKYFVKNEMNHENISAIFIIDLDNFKTANDTLGHSTGDKILQDTASSIKQIVRNTDLSGRLGGDEFVLLIKNTTNLEAIEKIAQKLNNTLKKSYSKNDKTVNISASIVIAILKENLSIEELYENADSALYKVKEKGRNSYLISY